MLTIVLFNVVLLIKFGFKTTIYMTAEQDRLDRINLGLRIILNAQRDLRRVQVTINGEKIVIDPMLLFDYHDNEDFKLSPFVMEFSTFAKSFQLDQVTDMIVLSNPIDPAINGSINLWTKDEIESRLKSVENAKLIGRVHFPTKRN